MQHSHTLPAVAGVGTASAGCAEFAFLTSFDAVLDRLEGIAKSRLPSLQNEWVDFLSFRLGLCILCFVFPLQWFPAHPHTAGSVFEDLRAVEAQ